jgi:glycosyltransferase involved in cell wall biosynthesis
MVPEAQLELHVYGVVQSDANLAFRRQLQGEFGNDSRVVLHDPVAADDVIDTIAQYDVLVAPSQQLETGPLVVLEAFAAGLPVVGSRLGGIAELVRPNVNGLLVDDALPEAWAATLRELSENRDVVRRLGAGVTPPRSMSVVADEMEAVYAKALRA